MMWDGMWSDYTVRVVVSGSAMIGAVSGSLGCFAYLRRQSLIGDVVSHASLLGIVLAFWIGFLLTGEGSKSLWLLIPGAIAAGLGSLLLTKVITRQTRIKEDAGLGVMLAIFFGTGMMLLRWMQRSRPPIPGRSGLEDYLFGMAAAITQDDLWMIGTLGVLSMATLIFSWSRLKVLTFDPAYAAGLGLPVRWLELLMLCLLVVGIVIGLQIVGVVLTIALLVAPASAARQWTRHLGTMVTLAAVIGAVSAASGALLSAAVHHLPTGPCIVIILTAVFLFSLFLAPHRGLLIRRKKRLVN
ncbi:MAG TPA: zinc transporter [Planctomycetaceae bacterium]|nr:zinc transporter [Blastopirellula sp.]HAY78753.1 zinc transporter [Planctomycetaceae bacterium]